MNGTKISESYTDIMKQMWCNDITMPINSN